MLRVSSPHGHAVLDTGSVMRLVIVASLPGVFVLTYFFGFGTLANILFAACFGIAFEAFALMCRKRPILPALNDMSAVLTALLLAVSLPPAAPWWLIGVGMMASILFAKHLYGGLGYNPFNPAMVGYVVLLISFPVEMTQWLAPKGSFEGTLLGPIDALKWVLVPSLVDTIDAVTMATPLDVVKQNQTLMMEELWQANSQFNRFAGKGWQSANIVFLMGGLFLLWKRVFTWHAPVGMLLSISLFSIVFYDGGSANSNGSPLFHLLSGATMFGAFFIVTDPVTSAVSNKGRFIYGLAIGGLVYLIRVWGNYPDAVAFSVLLLNFCAPFIDHYTQPRVYGHEKNQADR